jgi:WS/DGAT/MGAT family acyltransferase
MDRLKPLDAVFVDAEDEDPHTSMAIASIAVFQGPVPSDEEFLAYLAGRLPLVPPYRRKLRTVPFRLGRPVWVEDPNFDLRYHVRRTALPEPGGDRELANLMARVMSQRLDRDHPLWEYWVAEGLAGDRWALISKIHHCMVDGIAGTDLYRMIFDFTPEPAPLLPADEPTASGEPSSAWLAAQGALDLATLPTRQALALGRAVAAPGRAVRQTAQTARAMAKMAPALWPAARSSLSGQIGRERRYTWARASMDDILVIKHELGGTMNDVVLAAISGGLRELLLARGEQPEPHKVPSLVPVSVRAPGDESIYDNRVSAIIANLPVHVADPVDRLAAVRAELQSLKESKEALVGDALVTLGQYSPYLLASWWVRLALGLPQREIVTVTTNVPGPRQPLYGMGRRLEEIIPYVPIATTVRTGISIFTYCGNVTFGITGDFTANPDLDVLAKGIENGIAELVAAARKHAKPRTARQRPARSRKSAQRPAAGGDLPAHRTGRETGPHWMSLTGQGLATGRPSPSAQTRSRNSLISAVSRAGCTQSSAKVRVRISLASGSCCVSRSASLNEWMRSMPCPSTSVGAVMVRRWSMVGATGPSRMPCSTAAISSGSEEAALSIESSAPSPVRGKWDTTRETRRMTGRA